MTDLDLAMTSAAYHLAKLPPITDPDREWRYVSEDGRLVRVITVTGAPPRQPRPVYVPDPDRCDRCHRSVRWHEEHYGDRLKLDLQPAGARRICVICRRVSKEQVIVVTHWRIDEAPALVSATDDRRAA